MTYDPLPPVPFYNKIYNLNYCRRIRELEEVRHRICQVFNCTAEEAKQVQEKCLRFAQTHRVPVYPLTLQLCEFVARAGAAGLDLRPALQKVLEMEQVCLDAAYASGAPISEVHEMIHSFLDRLLPQETTDNDTTDKTS